MDLDRFEHFYIHTEVEGSPFVQRILHDLPKDKITFVDDRPFPHSKGELSKNEFDRSKKNIFFTRFKGQFFKRCPGARPGLACCNYFVLNLGLQCDMNCSYCYLQSFINTPVLTVYTNIESALVELQTLANYQANESFRIGTGEVIDSLSLDDLTLFSRELISFFKKYPKWKLEFKTKSQKVDQFLDLGPAPNVLVSWSINPQNIINSEEHGTASLQERLQAAVKCRNHGFKLAFHIDPMIWHPQWKVNYAELVDTLTTTFKPEDVNVISVGALRFQPEQKSIMRERFGFNNLVNSSEVFLSSDGKLRYDKRLRQEMYEFVVKKFKSHSSRWNVFFCMESPETWLQSTYNSLPKRVDGIGELFDHRLIKAAEEVFSNENYQ
ncbi:MAG: hypothetical protein KDD40_02990 [Bdellovibrionales bacterium]|nr:hypothetical protein [Bdellovibrionales bacterium]